MMRPGPPGQSPCFKVIGHTPRANPGPHPSARSARTGGAAAFRRTSPAAARGASLRLGYPAAALLRTGGEARTRSGTPKPGPWPLRPASSPREQPRALTRVPRGRPAGAWGRPSSGRPRFPHDPGTAEKRRPVRPPGPLAGSCRPPQVPPGGAAACGARAPTGGGAAGARAGALRWAEGPRAASSAGKGPVRGPASGQRTIFSLLSP